MTRIARLRSPLMTGATPPGHRHQPLSDVVTGAIERSLRVLGAVDALHNVISRVDDIVDRYLQSLIKATVYPSPETQRKTSLGLRVQTVALFEAWKARDKETRKRIHLAFTHQIRDPQRRRKKGLDFDRKVEANFERLIGALDFAIERAWLYRSLGRRPRNHTLQTVVTELVDVLEEAIGQRLVVSLNKAPTNGQPKTHGGAIALFFTSILREGCGVKISDAARTHLMREGRKLVAEWRELQSSAGSSTGDDRF